MTGWVLSAAFTRGAVVAAVGVVTALVAGRPSLLVLVAPLVLASGLGLRHRPRVVPRLATTGRASGIREGQAVRVSARLIDAGDVEVAVRSASRTDRVAMTPASGRVAGPLAEDGTLPELVVRPDRWGRVVLGEEQVVGLTRWAGFRWGPESRWGTTLSVLPEAPAYRSRAAVPHPVGLVGAHRSVRTGSGVEPDDVREFVLGDRVRRIHWRVSSRTGRLHVTTSPAEQDAAVVLVVDALADHGASAGPGTASSLDLSVRAAAAVAGHHLRGGDRVGLRVLGRPGLTVRPVAGRRQLRRLELTLAAVVPGDTEEDGSFRLGAPAGAVVVVLSPLLDERVSALAVAAQRRGHTVLVVDCLPPDTRPAVGPGSDPRVVEAAWRLRVLEREPVLRALDVHGCPHVSWTGPGSLDGVLLALARRGGVVRVRA